MPISKNTRVATISPLKHVVLIPDGNRRWARKRALPTVMGHQAGIKGVGKILETALGLEIPYVTLWGASVSNLVKRSPSEVAFLCRLFSEYFKKIGRDKKIHANKVRLNVIGRWRELLPPSTAKAIQEALDETRTYDRYHFTVLLAYSGVEEMTSAVTEIAGEARQNPAFKVEPATIAAHLWSKALPPVDLVIRTGGEPHWSEGMLMWHVANSQLHFTPTLWPDFGPEEFTQVAERYRKTERRLGA